MSNVIQLSNKAMDLNHYQSGSTGVEEPLSLSVPPELACLIRFTAGMHSKDPQEFLIDWLKSGFPDNAA